MSNGKKNLTAGKKHIKSIRLNDTDRRIILENLNICTDSHGEGCSSNGIEDAAAGTSGSKTTDTITWIN